jgi:hypothetical protein
MILDTLETHHFERAPQGPCRRNASVEILLNQDIDETTGTNEVFAAAAALPYDQAPAAHIGVFLVRSRSISRCQSISHTGQRGKGCFRIAGHRWGRNLPQVGVGWDKELSVVDL